ncbi:MAG: hypothetical protein AAGC43_04680 [Bacteroidota bacterium]
MDSIKNYRLKKFITLDAETIEDYITALRFLKPIPTKEEIFYLSLGRVQDIKEHMAEGKLNNLIQVMKWVDGREWNYRKENNVENMRIIEFFSKINSVVEQLETIAKAEVTSLTSENSNIKWDAVDGPEKMSVFGIYNTLDRLAGGNILEWERVLKLSYADVFTKLYMDRVKNDLEYQMSKIKTDVQ